MSIICYANHRYQRQHLQIYWNSSNTLFQSSGYLTVYLGDLIDFLCPYYDNEYTNLNIEYNTIYLVNENDYYHCNTTNYNPLIKCNKPFDLQPLVYTLSISKYLPYPNIPEFADGQYYYFISTSMGQLENIDQHHNGLCYTKNMKLILNVQKYTRHYHEQQRKKTSKLIIAKRTNLTFVDPDKRTLSFSSLSSITSQNFYYTFTLLVFCLLTKSRS
ncbi:unnamed protein product [Adineta steineri]|uniref:Ephrin RBD domain-containing protein n=1 Tax=Adineta steineri TaxID=433720 RepID=A0A815LLD3_9BILA|nr:unnamed protein product [Adineta steineri]CAF1043466.1 unnamed protein product [Adineta steineri]CAF1410961.1 unnamed protein product [Adineta steineri]CAF1617567.1 unnamed protein product [Adineta steineri]